MKKIRFSVLTVVLIAVFTAVCGAIIGHITAAVRYNSQLGDIFELEQKYAKLKEVSDIVEKYYVGEYDENAALDGALSGFVDGVGDKWSHYYNAEQTKRVNEYSSNSYVGIGATVSTTTGGLYEIVSVTRGGPAFNAGIAIGDVISAVDGVSASEYKTSDDLVAVVKGEAGTKVKLTVLRDGAEKSFTVKREKVFSEAVEARMLGGSIGYVAISHFETNVDKEFTEKVNELMDKGAKALIFDVRMNGGGYVSVMKNMLDILLPEGLVISMVEKDGETTEYRSDAACIRCPMAVLTNEYSISAAEFFAAALQEYGVATVVGDRTGGKGFSQSLFKLSDGSSLNLSISRYYTPKGASLADTGVTPDVEVSLSDEDFVNFYRLKDSEDTQLVAAIEAVKKLDIPTE